MNNELEILADWFRANKLSLNISKTKYILFSRSCLLEEDLLLMISNNKTKCIQFLGRHIDDKLNWQKHTSACKNKLTSALYILNKVNRYFPVAAL